MKFVNFVLGLTLLATLSDTAFANCRDQEKTSRLERDPGATEQFVKEAMATARGVSDHIQPERDENTGALN